MATLITPDLDITPQGTLVRIDQKLPELEDGKIPVAFTGDLSVGDITIESVGINNTDANPVPVSDAGGSITVDAASLPLPTGAATSANQSTIIGHVDGIEGLLTTIDADTGSIDGKLPALSSGRVPVDGSGVTQPVSDASGSLTVDGKCYRGAYTITRPANTTAYTAGDVIGDTGGSAITTLTNIGPSGGFIQIQSIRLLIYSGTLPTGMTTLRLHLYSASPTAIADNAAWDLLAGDRTAYLDYIDLPTPTDMGSTLFSKVDYPGSLLKLADASTSLYAVLQTVTAATFAENSTVLDLRINAIEMGL